MLYKLCSCMYYQEMNSISFKASVQILYIVLCNYCTTCIIYRDKIKFKLRLSNIEHTNEKLSNALQSLIDNIQSIGTKSYTVEDINCTNEACIGVLGIQDICHFTSRDIGYYPFDFQGYGILCSIFSSLPGILKI